jgi:hypothetical protein
MRLDGEIPISLMATIKLTIDGEESWHESVPSAVAQCRRHFMAGGIAPGIIRQDDLIYTVEIAPDWDGVRLP